MSLYVTPEQKKAGEENFLRAVGSNRREFLKVGLAAGAAIPLGAALFFGYKQLQGKAVKTAVIGTGDEGGVLVGAHNPEYLEIVAICDIRPTNLKRIFDGEKPPSPRLGLNKIYGRKTAAGIKRFQCGYKDLFDDLAFKKLGVEAVIIALPLFQHADAAIKAMDAGLHVLCEKLMAWNVLQCKQMVRTARDKDRVLTIGHQRHYSLLYHHALDVIKSGQLGDIRHIRALWHRNNAWPLLENGQPVKDEKNKPMLRDSWRKRVPKEDREALEKIVKDYDYDNVEQLVRWRLFRRTGGGLMAELGSHQLDACSIFLGKVKPLSVSGYGARLFYRDERDIADHVFTTFEFPGKDYAKDKEDKVVVTYSSINTNSFEPYGECVMGQKGTLLVENEQSAGLYPERDPYKKAADKGLQVSVTTAGAGQPAADTTATTGFAEPAAAVSLGQAVLGPKPVSRGYREEMEDFAYCVRMHDAARDSEERKLWREGPAGKPGEPHGPRCHGLVAMADAVIALTSNLAMDTGKRIVFDPKWFALSDDPNRDADEVPEKHV
jgi:predicted dehydrogenase